MNETPDPAISLEAAYLHAVGAEPGAILTEAQCADMLVVTRFCVDNKLVPGGGEYALSLFGYGEADADFVASTFEKRYWVDLEKLVEPTGIDRQALIADWESEWAERRDTDAAGWKPHVAALDLHDRDGRPMRLRLYSEIAILGLFMGLSPWSEEFCKATLPAMRRAAVASGVARMFGNVVQIADDGTAVDTGMTLEDVILADGPLPSKDEAHRMAQAGPLGGFTTEGE